MVLSKVIMCHLVYEETMVTMGPIAIYLLELRHGPFTSPGMVDFHREFGMVAPMYRYPGPGGLVSPWCFGEVHQVEKGG